MTDASSCALCAPFDHWERRLPLTRAAEARPAPTRGVNLRLTLALDAAGAIPNAGAAPIRLLRNKAKTSPLIEPKELPASMST